MPHILNQRKCRCGEMSLHFFIYLLGVIGFVNGNNKSWGVLQKCSNFFDVRTKVDVDRESSDFTLTIPSNLGRQDEELYFTVKPGDLNCEGAIYGIDLTMPPSNPNVANFARSFDKTVELANKKYPIHLTSDGHFFNGKYFLSPKSDFCLHSVSDDELKLMICPPKCNGKDKNIICFPKCCALDEVFVYKSCVKLNDTKKRYPYWKPDLYEKGWLSGYIKVPQKHFKFYIDDIPSDCNYEGDFGAELRPRPSIPLKNPDHPLFPIPKYNIRFTQDKNGDVKPMLLNLDLRKWVIQKTTQFCADGLIDHEKGTGGSGQIKIDGFMLFSCVPPVVKNLNGPMVARLVKATANKMATIYTVVGIISLPFLLLTVIVYLVILDRLNLHGLTILSYSITELMSYTLLVMVQLIFINNSEWTGIGKGGWTCYLIATSTHFFSLSSYVWILVMNFDLWMTFRSLRVVKREAKELKTFSAYCAVGWGVPLILILLFVTLDKIYNDPTSEVPVPLYGTSSCFVANQFEGYYVFIPMAVIISMNIVLILLTMKIFFDAGRQKKTLGVQANDSKYSAKLFAKLFVIMGGSSLFNFVSWHYYDRPEETPWAIVILGSVTYLIPIILFILFCLNDRTLGQLQEKFPRLKGFHKVPGMFFRRREEDSTSSASAVTTVTSDSSNNRGERLPLKGTSTNTYQ